VIVHSNERARAVAIFAIVLGTSSAAWAQEPVGSAPSAGATDKTPPAQQAEAAPLPEAELGKMLGKTVTGDDEAQRIAAAKAIIELGTEALPAITTQLAELRKGNDNAVFQAVKAVRDQHGGKLEGVELLPELQKKKGDGAGYRVALQTVVLAHALARMGTTPAVKQLTLIAADHNMQLRPEVTRLIKGLGERAVAGLIETRKADNSELRRYATRELEGLGKRVPGDAVQTKENQVLSDVLRAYGNVHDTDAIPVILSFVNTDRAQVRAAAREALAQFGQDAIWKLRESYMNLTGKAASEGWSAAEVAKELFAAYDRFRLQEVHQLVEDGKAKEKEGKLEEANALFDKALAREPMLDRRDEMVPAALALAQSLQGKEPERARALLRKALRLSPEGPRKNQIQAELAYMEGKELLGRGVADTEPFQRALALDPAHEKARAELYQLEDRTAEERGRTQRYGAAAAVVLLGIVLIVLFGGRKKPRATKRAPAA
jgi:tetratricopeptide (TPR) repeat protein